MIIKNISTLMYTVWHVDKYKITFKLVIDWTNEILQHIVVSSGLSWSGIIDASARYRAAARRLRNTALNHQFLTLTNAILLAHYTCHKLFVSVHVSSYTRSIQFPFYHKLK
jgi:hypothetical protein